MRIVQKHNYKLAKGSYLLKLERSVPCASCSSKANYMIKTPGENTQTVNICGGCLKRDYS